MNWQLRARIGLGVASGILMLGASGCAGAFSALLSDEEKQEGREAVELERTQESAERLAHEQREAIRLASRLLNCSESLLDSEDGFLPVLVTGCHREALCDYAHTAKGLPRIACGETHRSKMRAAYGAAEDPDVVDAIKTVSLLIECRTWKMKASDGDFPIRISGCGRTAICSRVPHPLVGSDNVLFTLCKEEPTTAMVKAEAEKTASTLFRCPIEKISVERSSRVRATGCGREALCRVITTSMGDIMQCDEVPSPESGQSFAAELPLPTLPNPMKLEFADARSSGVAYRLRAGGTIYVCSSSSGRTACSVSPTPAP